MELKGATTYELVEEMALQHEELLEKLRRLAVRWDARSMGNVRDTVELAEHMVYRECAHDLAALVGSPEREGEEDE